MRFGHRGILRSDVGLSARSEGQIDAEKVEAPSGRDRHYLAWP